MEYRTAEAAAARSEGIGAGTAGYGTDCETLPRLCRIGVA